MTVNFGSLDSIVRALVGAVMLMLGLGRIMGATGVPSGLVFVMGGAAIPAIGIGRWEVFLFLAAVVVGFYLRHFLPAQPAKSTA